MSRCQIPTYVEEEVNSNRMSGHSSGDGKSHDVLTKETC